MHIERKHALPVMTNIDFQKMPRTADFVEFSRVRKEKIVLRFTVVELIEVKTF
jgi:hypothetical protein